MFFLPATQHLNDEGVGTQRAALFAVNLPFFATFLTEKCL